MSKRVTFEKAMSARKGSMEKAGFVSGGDWNYKGKRWDKREQWGKGEAEGHELERHALGKGKKAG